MTGLVSAVLILTEIGTNLWLMVYLMESVKVVSAIQTAWGHAEGLVQSIPWIPLFVAIPVAAVVGTIYVAEKYLKLAKDSGIRRLLKFSFRVWSVQLGALCLGQLLYVIGLAGGKTVESITVLVLLTGATIVLWKLPTSKWGKRVLSQEG